MLIRISLIIAIVAGLAAAGIGFLKVREKIVTTMAERDDEAKQKMAAQKERDATKKTLKTTQEDLATTQKTLASTKKELETQTAHANDLEKQKTTLTTQLAEAKTGRDTAEQKLIIWEAFNLSPEQMKASLADLKTTRQQRDAFAAENKVFQRENKKLQAKINDLIGDEPDVPLPVGLKGNVIVVDPKYDFVVLDIGGDQGVLERGVMLINRRGVLVGKVRIASVSPQRSVANIIPDSKNPTLEVMEGDQVVY
ncbi:MAG: hypothetical protein ABIQ35_02665 [Verrucomicrobiota bacterium]